MNTEVNSKSTEDTARAPRATHDRLDSLLSRRGEALSPRALRKLLEQLQAIIDPRIGEVEGGRRAQAFITWYDTATAGERLDAWLLMSEQFVADQAKSKAAQAQYAAAIGTSDEAVAEVRLRRATVSPRRRILQRISVLPEGVRFLVNMREQLLPHLRTYPSLAALDVEMEYMFSTWFDVGFLELRSMNWDSPASLLEKLIKYEAVHDIRSWADLKNRLDSDRRCYGFFHPRLPDEPLIFVEVALLGDMAGSITPLLDESAAPADLAKATTAIFYSISNTQAGLRGVSFGDSLIKHVVDTLKTEFPRLKVFATLSPIPGLRGWMGKNAARLLEATPSRAQQALARELGEAPTAKNLLTALDGVPALKESSAVRRWLLASAAQYLALGIEGTKPLDPVARFHLGNGARVERLNWMADPSAKGLKQSFGLMVNYLYDLNRLDKHKALLTQGKVPVSGQLKGLMD
ncbi:malonyl-CoA decarboxylase [Ottowia thiooxydans]|uniref:Malonyl-CoA decarboxylase n=1 Tax=Ottowia thiooxydans TaxID=219182 RepID=A0ABV2QHG9_9BURK